MAIAYTVTIKEQPKGLIFKSRRWHWERPNGCGIETYSRTATLLTVRAHIGRLNRCHIGDVRITKTTL